MKNIISAAIIATVATVGTMASADITTKGLVFRDGVAIGSMYDVKVMDGKTDAEARSEIKAHYVKAKADAKRERDQEVKQKANFAANNIFVPADLKDAAKGEVDRILAEATTEQLEAAEAIAKANGTTVAKVVEAVKDVIDNGALSRDAYNEVASVLEVTVSFDEAKAIADQFFADVRAELAADA